MYRTLKCHHSLETVEQYFTVVLFVFSIILSGFVIFGLDTVRSEMVNAAECVFPEDFCIMIASIEVDLVSKETVC